MQVVVPFAARTPKTRLRDVLDPDERVAFARTMLGDVLDALASTDAPAATVLATAPVGTGFEAAHDVVVDDQPLTAAVDDALDPPTAVVMADLALATPDALERLFAPDADVVLAPGRGGGTNALVTRHPEFAVDYHGASFRDHRAIARDIDADLATVDSFRLATDVDERADLAEVLLHGEGRTAEWLRDAGFELDVTNGRVGVERR